MEISLILTSGCCQSILLSSPLLCTRVHVVLKDSDRGLLSGARARAHTADTQTDADDDHEEKKNKTKTLIILVKSSSRADFLRSMWRVVSNKQCAICYGLDLYEDMWMLTHARTSTRDEKKKRRDKYTKIVLLPLGGRVLSVQSGARLCTDDGSKHQKGDQWRSAAAYSRLSGEITK